MTTNDRPWMIVIAERGWVYVGTVHRDGDQVVIENCYNVRRWGTTSGLGELALQGPRGATVLDYYGKVRVHVLAIAGGFVECDQAVWSAWREKQVGAAVEPTKGKRK